MAKDMMEEFCEDRDFARLVEQEIAIMDVTELICGIMEDQGVSRSELAERLGTSKSNVTQTLDGTRNMTIRKISDILFELGHSLKVDIREPQRLRSRKPVQDVFSGAPFRAKNNTWVSRGGAYGNQGAQGDLSDLPMGGSKPESDFRIAS
jgi:antitoxin component HigA of HigAB toxin-antitoxin module